MIKQIFILVICMIALASCKKDEQANIINIKNINETMYSGDSVNINAQSSLPLVYASANEYNAIVSKSGIITAFFIGETDISVTDGTQTKLVHVRVKPKYDLYPDPFLQFGETRNSLIYKLGQPSQKTDSAIFYLNYSESAQVIEYLFDSSNKLKSVAVFVKTSYSSELGGFLAERYFPIIPSDHIFINAFKRNKATLEVAATLYNLSYWLVAYLPYTSNKNINISDLKAISLPNMNN